MGRSTMTKSIDLSRSEVSESDGIYEVRDADRLCLDGVWKSSLFSATTALGDTGSIRCGSNIVPEEGVL